MTNPFVQAVKNEAKLRLAIAGPSGSGKTYTALALATALGDRVAVIDTEHGSASKYADIFGFDVLELKDPFHPNNFTAAIHAAGNAGYGVVIVDSITHAWGGAGGALELVDKIKPKYKGNAFAAWGEVTPIHNRMVESILAAPAHVIVTMRSKQSYILVENRGRQVPQKVGMAPIQRDGFEYEFDVFLDMDTENNAIVNKTRCPLLIGKVFSKPGAELAEILVEWLKGEPAERVQPDSNGSKQKVATNREPAQSSNGQPETTSKEADARDYLEQFDAPILGNVAAAAVVSKTGYGHATHGMAALCKNEKIAAAVEADKMKCEPGQRISGKAALELLDWLMTREHESGKADDPTPEEQAEMAAVQAGLLEPEDAR